jgi:hypothetical protein
MKFPTAPESTRAVDTTFDGQPASDMDTRKGFVQNEDGGILTPNPGEGLSRDGPSALVDHGLGHIGHCSLLSGNNKMLKNAEDLIHSHPQLSQLVVVLAKYS